MFLFLFKKRETVRLYEQGASSKCICQYWLGWATATILWANAVAAGSCPNVNTDNSLSSANGVENNTVLITCLASSPNASYVTSDYGISNSNHTFILALPDSNPSGSTYPARAYSFDSSTSSTSTPPDVSCSAATITPNTYSTSILLSDGDSCALTITSPTSQTKYTATLSRTGALYTVSAGQVCGGVFGGCTLAPVAAPIPFASVLLSGGFILLFGLFRLRRRSS